MVNSRNIFLFDLLNYLVDIYLGNYYWFFGVAKWASPDKITSSMGEMGEMGGVENFSFFREEMIALSEETNRKNPPSEEEIKKQWELQNQENLKRIKNEGFTDSVQGLIAAIVVMPIFIIHWRKTRIYGKK